MRYIRDYTSCFGPKRLGSNLLINRFNDVSKSFFRIIEELIGETFLPSFDDSSAKIEKLSKDQE